MKTLIVVDMQNDFIDGALGTAEAVAIVPNVCSKLEEARNSGAQVIFTRDTHLDNYMSTQEGKNLPVPHCIKGTKGWEITGKLQVKDTDCVVDKITFGHVWSADMIKGDEVELVGLCTDICVISNAFTVKSFLPEVPLIVDASCCAGVTPEKHAAALEVMKSCQINVKE